MPTRPFSDGVPNGATSLTPNANSPITVDVLDALDHLAQPPGVVAALDLDGLAALDRPGDRLGDLARQADPEHHAVDDDVPTVCVLDGRERDLGPQRQRAHHLAALLDRGRPRAPAGP